MSRSLYHVLPMKVLITCISSIVTFIVSLKQFNHHAFSLTFLIVLAITRKNTNAASIMLYLHKLTEVFTEYFKELEEESIRDNFVIVYELLDEMMDFGYPQTTETKILQE